MKEKFFNTAGPVKENLHYLIPFYKRLDWDDIQQLIASEKYFLLHAPRQTGKTSALLEMMAELNSGDTYHVLYANIESAQVSRNNVDSGIEIACSVISRAARLYLKEERLIEWLRTRGREVTGGDRLNGMLTYWAEISDRPTVLFLDETDALVGDTLVSLLRQIRSGYNQRPHSFPQSIVLCGLRDIKDYRIHISAGDIITGGSAFNIKAKSLRLGNFTPEEIEILYTQHTEATGQHFEGGILNEVWQDTNGQPWLVNALAHEMTWEDKNARDRTNLISLNQYWAARERLIQSRATHLDQLADKLREARVQQTISALLATEETGLQIPLDDLQYVEDLGLIVRRPHLHISNRIYREIIPRELILSTQETIAEEQEWYLTSENRLDMVKLLAAFQQFFRDHAESWIERFDYKEAGPQLLMQTFLQRIINGGGRINREYGLGRKRTDLAIEWPVDKEKGYYGPVQRIVIELKILRGNLDTALEKGLKQTAAYGDLFNADELHLILFNRDPEISWDDKIWYESRKYEGQPVHVWGS